jgi:hypothetical protein
MKSLAETYRDTYRLNRSFAEHFRGNSQAALEVRLIASGVAETDPKVKELRAVIAEYSRQPREFLATVQQSWSTLLKIQEGNLGDLTTKVREIAPDSDVRKKQIDCLTPRGP